MNSPVNVLCGNIIQTFENIDSSSLEMHKGSTSSGKISKTIPYDNGNEKLKTPFSNTDTREINIQETYLSHLWSFIYSVFVMYEEGVQKPLINDTFDGTLNFDAPLIKRAKSLFDWSISLTDKYSAWDESLPNPKHYHSDEEKFYSEKVNSIYQSAVAFILFHEAAHLMQGHESFFFKAGANDLDPAAIADRIQIENEADKFAFNMLIKETDSEKDRWIKGISILLATCSSLLIVPRAHGIKQKTHPDVDQRIVNALHQLNLYTDEAQFYCWYLCGFAVKLFLIKHDINTQQETYETAKDAFTAYLEMLDRIKECPI
jgi:hypothetical protein